MFVSSTVGLNTIGVGTGNIIRLGTELIGVGETINSSTNFVGFSTRGLDNTPTAGTMMDATVRVYTNAGSATTIREGTLETEPQQTSQSMRLQDSIQMTWVDLGDTISGEIFVKVTGVTTSSALTPSTTKDWYESQTLGLSNSTVFWKNVVQNLVLLTTQHE